MLTFIFNVSGLAFAAVFISVMVCYFLQNFSNKSSNIPKSSTRLNQRSDGELDNIDYDTSLIVPVPRAPPLPQRLPPAYSDTVQHN